MNEKLVMQGRLRGELKGANEQGQVFEFENEGLYMQRRLWVAGSLADQLRDEVQSRSRVTERSKPSGGPGQLHLRR